MDVNRRDFLAGAAGAVVAATGAGVGASIAGAGTGAPQPVRGSAGAEILGPRNEPVEQENPDLVAPPATDSGTLPNLKFSFDAAHTRITSGGWAREVTVRELPAATQLAGVDMRLKPGAIRELHWHKPGRARMTVFASDGTARTFDYQAGDVGYVPFAMGHYVENTGSEPVRFLEMFRSDHYADVSLDQWLALTPPELVQAHLNIDRQTIRALSKTKPIIVR